MTTHTVPDVATVRQAVREKYTDVANHPNAEFHFDNGRPLAQRLGYPMELVDSMPAVAIESFSGMGNPFSVGPLSAGV